MDKNSVLCLIIHMLNSMHHTMSQKVSEIFDFYTELHDIRISLFSPDGKLIYPDTVGRPNCRHCILLRDTLGMDSKCRALDHKMMHVALERQDMISYTCHAGMREATAPIMVSGKLVGYVMLGQFRSEAAPDVSPYAGLWMERFGNADLQQAYDQTTVFPEHKIETLLAMFRQLLEFIVGGQLIRHKDYDLIQPVIERIQEHPQQELTLEMAAKMAGRSASALSRLFKRATGRSFKQYQMAHRMEQARKMLENMPNRPVGEVARSVGYEDPLYFSRIFRKFHGVSPTGCRKASSSTERHG
jgi:AraC-like DNA-binding protein